MGSQQPPGISKPPITVSQQLPGDSKLTPTNCILFILLMNSMNSFVSARGYCRLGLRVMALIQHLHFCGFGSLVVDLINCYLFGGFGSVVVDLIFYLLSLCRAPVTRFALRGRVRGRVRP